MKRLGLLTSIVCAVLTVPAQAIVVLDFESLRQETDQSVIIVGTSYAENGFLLAATCCEPFAGSQSTDLRTAGTLSPNFPGSTTLRGGKTATLITLSSIDGSLFDLVSVDIAALAMTVLVDDVLVPIDPGTPFLVTFEGLQADGDIVSHTVSHEDFLSLTTYVLDGFNDLVSTSWFQGSEGFQAGDAHQFDNIVIRSTCTEFPGGGVTEGCRPPPNPIPEPSILALLAAGLLGLAYRRRVTCPTRS